MYTRRAAALVSLTSLRRAIKVCRRIPSDYRCSVEIPNFVRSFRTATESTDVYNNFDGGSTENQSGYVNFHRNDQFYGGSLGGVEQNQNPSRVYCQTGTDKLNLSNTFGNGGGSVQNQSGYSSSSFDSRNYGRNIVGGEAGRVPDGQNFGGQMGNGTFQQNVSSNGGVSNATPLNHAGVRLENSDRLNLSNTFGNGSSSVQNQSGYNSWSFDNRKYGRNVVGCEADRIPNRQNYGGQMGNGTFRQNVSSNGGISDAAPLNHGGVRLENWRGGSYGGIEDMPVKNCGNSGVHPQNVAGSYYSNAGNYQRSLSESQSGVVMNDLAMNAGSVEVARGSQSTSKLDDLDQLTREGKLKEAVELLVLLEKERIRVELPRYVALIKACGENEALAEAKSVHEHLMKSMVYLEVRVYNQIIEMYSKCGSMEDAFAVFDQMPERNLTSWDIMISWLAKNGHGEESLELFAEFKQSGLRPDGQMFLGVFSACGVVSDVVEGMLHFESMMNDYGVVPAMEHYAGIVDMLGCAGCLDEASEFIQKMPFKPSVAIWETLMKFCRIHGNVVLGDQCAELVQLLDPSRLNEQSREGLIPLNASDMDKEKEKKKKKSIGQGPLDVRHRVHEYRAGDRSHPDNERLYGLLRALKQHMKEAGYVPEIKCVLHDVDQETKEEALMAHSERLAAAHGFLTSPARSSIRIIKNLRVCSDCHNVFKIISKIVGREIVARDSKRFHHFRDGSCSCNDFW